MSIIFLLASVSSYETAVLIPLILLFFLIGIAMYSQVSYKIQFRRLATMIKNIDFRPLEGGLSKLERLVKESNLKVSDLEKRLDGLDSYKIEQEKKYRKLVRKILEVDNKLNQKYKRLGESIIELSKKIKKS